MRLAFIVVAYRSAAEIPGYLESIRADAGPDCEIVVVDNASPDESQTIAAAHPSKPTVVVSEVNRGFGAGCNLGARNIDPDTEAVFMLNPDARLHPGTTARLIAALAANRRLGLVAPRVLDPSGESRATSAGAEPTLRSSIGHFLALGRIPGVRWLFRPVYLVDGSAPTQPGWVSGAAMLIRKSAFDEVGGFDERYFMYMEDVDLCRRLREQGWLIDYRPDAIVDHVLGHSQSTDQVVRWYTAFHRYVAVNHGSFQARAVALVAALGMGLRAVAYRGRRPVNSARMALGAKTAMRFAFIPPSRDLPPDGAPNA
jgi:N-acetylglucosaminyl-diphospho-decaprenol L-rhamnosyltransferase